MHPTHDDEQPAGSGEGFDPRQAAALLDHTVQDARRQFDSRPPVVMALMAVLVLAAYAALWLSTRGQHPYRGPSGDAIALIYGVVAVCAVVASIVHRRARAGVGGSSIRLQRIEGVALALSVAGSPMIQGAMRHYHASDTIVYGVIPAAGPLVVIGTTLLGIAAVKADRPEFAAGLVVVAGGMVALFVGPSGAWLAAGIAIFLAIISFAVGRAGARSGLAWARTSSTR